MELNLAAGIKVRRRLKPAKHSDPQIGRQSRIDDEFKGKKSRLEIKSKWVKASQPAKINLRKAAFDFESRSVGAKPFLNTTLGGYWVWAALNQALNPEASLCGPGGRRPGGRAGGRVEPGWKLDDGAVEQQTNQPVTTL